MTFSNKLTYLSAVALLGLWGCSSSQLATRTDHTQDDLYGTSADVRVATRTTTRQQDDRYANPDFRAESTNDPSNGNADYYDESYLSSRNVQRRVSDDPGFNAGFREGYNAGRFAFYDPFFMNNLRFGAFGPMAGSAFSMGFQMGLNRSMRFGFSPFNRFGGMFSPWDMYSFGSPWGWNGFGYDPFGYNMAFGGFNGWGSPWGMGGWNSWGNPWGFGGFNSWGNPWGFGGMYGFNPYYGGFGNRVFVVNNSNDPGRATRSYGPRSTATRGSSSYNSGFNNTARSSRNSGGREAYTRESTSTSRGTTSSDAYYARPRANSSGTYYRGDGSTAGRSSAGRTSAESYNSRGTSSGSNSGYYSRPRSSSSSTYNSGQSRSSRTYNSTPSSSSRSGSSNSTYQPRSRSSWESGSRSSSTPSYNSGSTYNSGRSSSSGSVSAPSRSSAPSSSPSRSRGPR